MFHPIVLNSVTLEDFLIEEMITSLIRYIIYHILKSSGRFIEHRPELSGSLHSSCSECRKFMPTVCLSKLLRTTRTSKESRDCHRTWSIGYLPHYGSPTFSLVGEELQTSSL